MSTVTIEVERAQDGTEYKRTVPYEPPVFPSREYIIEIRASKETVLVCPGQFTEIQHDEGGKRIFGGGSDEDGPKKRGAKEKAIVHHTLKCNGWRPLSDSMHATRMTTEEASDFARRHKWSKETHRIFKA